MNIVLVTHFYPAHGGGVERVAEQIARRLARDHGMSVLWCASDTDAAPNLPGVTALPMRTANFVERLTDMPYPLWSPGAVLRLARVIRAADAVHVHDCVYPGSIVAATLARWFGKRLVVTQHIGDVPIRNPLLRWTLVAANRIGGLLVLRRAHAVAFISLMVKAYFESLLGRRHWFIFNPNGVDTEVFTPGTLPQAEYRNRLGFDSTRPLLLFVGRFVAKKGLPVVRALAQGTPQWQWCLIGEGPDDPRSWQLPNVVVSGPFPQVALPDYYRAADALVLPSESEGFPLVVQEAMACGLRVAIPPEVAAAVALPAVGHTPISPSVLRVEENRLVLSSFLDTESKDQAARRSTCARYARERWDWATTTQRYAALLRDR